jgi:hypothetical protein
VRESQGTADPRVRKKHGRKFSAVRPGPKDSSRCRPSIIRRTSTSPNDNSHRPPGRYCGGMTKRPSHREPHRLSGSCANMSTKRLPPGFIIPAQPVLASRPRSGPGWVHEIKHDDYRIIVRRDGPWCGSIAVTQNDWTDSVLLRTVQSGSKPRASRSTARPLCSGLTTCRGSRS